MATKLELQALAENVNIIDNGANEISAEMVRNQLEQERNSAFNVDDNDSFSISHNGTDTVGNRINNIDSRLPPLETFVDRTVNRGFAVVEDVDGSNIGDTFGVFGDVVSSEVVGKGGDNITVKIVFANNLPSTDYNVRFSLESRSGNIAIDGGLESPPVYRIISNNTIHMYFITRIFLGQNLRVHLETIKY